MNQCAQQACSELIPIGWHAKLQEEMNTMHSALVIPPNMKPFSFYKIDGRPDGLYTGYF